MIQDALAREGYDASSPVRLVARDLEEQLGLVETIAQNAVDKGFLHQDEWQKVLETLRAE